jgi:hypothetical protein
MPHAPCHTSEIEWTVTWTGGLDNGLIERYVTRTADGAVWESNLGDENGFHRSSLAHSPDSISRAVPGPGMTDAQIKQLGLVEVPKKGSAGTINRVVCSGEAWHLNANKPVAGSLAPTDHPSARLPVDLQSIGLAVSWEFDAPLGSFGIRKPHSDGLESAQVSERTEEGRTTITANYSENELTWVFDSNQGGLPVQATLSRNGRVLHRSQTRYKQVKGRWIPDSVEFFSADSSNPYKNIEVERATFDEPWHAQAITADDTGRVYGTRFVTPDDYPVWNGYELMDKDEFWELMYFYEVFPDERILQVEAENAGMTSEEYVNSLRRYAEDVRENYFRKHGRKPWLEEPQRPKRAQDEWDVYVEKFIAEHKLPEPAVKRAHEIRDQAKKLRDARRRQHAAQVRVAKKEGDEKKLDHFEALEKKIFDRVLAHNLKKLIPDKTDSARPPAP